MKRPIQGPAKTAVDVAEVLVRRNIEPALGGTPLWNHGLGAVVRELVVESGIPDEPLDMVKIARNLGVLPKKPRGRG